ncbi:uncharacterized protein LOC101857607 [Aplysia californica]|uniref:Uncharacterized protein LOC101857607 n=1 Tax=Aplysia californica TaxID=6500 RepID=A0ABM0K7E7_APLCA|nr:uncharacterized protein LOC101857607 [Aplysia californica]
MNSCANSVFRYFRPQLSSLKALPLCVQSSACGMSPLTRQIHHVASVGNPYLYHQHEFVENGGIVCGKSAIKKGQFLGTTLHLIHSKRATSKIPTDAEKALLVTEMNMRLLNENSFLSWCRNAYLSTVVGVAMITEGTTALAQGAGAGALAVGAMNLFWGTGCHVVNLIRLRHVTGMSTFTLFLNLIGSTLHCCLWLFVLICYIGFLDETRSLRSSVDGVSPIEVTNVHLDSRNSLPKSVETVDV